MPETRDWLCLEVQNPQRLGQDFPVRAGLKAGFTFIISIPKKIVRLATQRNRIKRLIREAWRQEKHLDSKRIYFFRVKHNPGNLNLKKVQKEINQLIRLI